jgi:hypothetical protein
LLTKSVCQSVNFIPVLFSVATSIWPIQTCWCKCEPLYRISRNPFRITIPVSAIHPFHRKKWIPCEWLVTFKKFNLCFVSDDHFVPH